MSQLNIENIDFYKQNIRFVDNLNLDELKTRYGWFLNATVENVVLGQTADKQLIWYSGTWKNGIWKNGIWCSGIWEDGEWWNGDWFSYDFSRYDLITYKKTDTEISSDIPMLSILNKKETLEASKFLKGRWKSGNFFYGQFGVEDNYDLTNNLYNTITPNSDETLLDIYWESGVFNKGTMVNTIFSGGVYKRGKFLNSIFTGGAFYEGVLYNSVWKNGNWYGGDFMKGVWENGNFSQINKDIVCRFGYNSNTDSKYPLCIWKDGNFYSGDYFCGYDIIDSNYVTSNNNYLSVWYGGNFHGGTWYGGMFLDGNWYNGLWKNGIFGLYSTIDYHYTSTKFEESENILNYWKEDEYLHYTHNNTGSSTSKHIDFSGFNIDTGFLDKFSSSIDKVEIKVSHDGFNSTVNDFKMYSYISYIFIYSGDFDNGVGFAIPHYLTDEYKIGSKRESIFTNTTALDESVLIRMFENFDTLNIRIEYISLYGLVENYNQTINIKDLSVKFYFKNQDIFEGISNDSTEDDVLLVRDMIENSYKKPAWYNGTWENGTAINATVYDTADKIGHTVNCNFIKNS